MKKAMDYIGEIGPKLEGLSKSNPDQLLPTLFQYFNDERKKISSKEEYKEFFSAFDTFKEEIFVQLGWDK